MKKPKKKYDSLEREIDRLTWENKQLKSNVDEALNVICSCVCETENEAINFLMDSRKK